MTPFDSVSVVTNMASNPYIENNPLTHTNGHIKFKTATSKLLSSALRPKLAAISKFLPQHSSRTRDMSSPSPSMSSTKSREIYERRSESPGKRNGHIPGVRHSPSSDARGQRKFGRMKSVNQISPQKLRYSVINGSAKTDFENSKINRSENNNNVTEENVVKSYGNAKIFQRNGVAHTDMTKTQRPLKTVSSEKEDAHIEYEETKEANIPPTQNSNSNHVTNLNAETSLPNSCGDTKSSQKMNSKLDNKIQNGEIPNPHANGNVGGIKQKEHVSEHLLQTRNLPRNKPRKAVVPVMIKATDYFQKSLAERIIEVRKSTGFVPGTSNYTNGLGAPIDSETAEKSNEMTIVSSELDIKLDKEPYGTAKDSSDVVNNNNFNNNNTVICVESEKMRNNRVDVTIAGTQTDCNKKKHKPDLTPVEGENTRPIVKRRQKRLIRQY